MNDRVLVLSPHTDDGELGCGGRISKFVEMGKEVKLVAFSTAEKSLPDGFESDSTKKEMFRACNILGLKDENITVLDFEVRIFSKFRQEILDSLIKIRNDFNPHIVMIPSQKDTHQDHEVRWWSSHRHRGIVALRPGYRLPCTFGNRFLDFAG